MSEPLVSVICVSNRPLFIPGMLEMFRAQTHPWKELILIDASEGGKGVEIALSDMSWLEYPADFIYEQAPVKCPVGRMRNQGLKRARGSFMSWMDDDGWHDPRRIEVLLAEIEKQRIDAIGIQGLYWIDIKGDFRHYRGTPHFPINNSMVWRRACAARHQLPEGRRKASDHFWISHIRDDPELTMKTVDEPTLCVGMSHGFNLSNPNPPALARPISTASLQDFYPDKPYGLKAHLERVREAVAKMRETA